MDTRIPQLPYIPGPPIDPSTDLIEIAQLDPSSATGYTSIRAKIEDIASNITVPIVPVNQIAFGDGINPYTYSASFKYTSGMLELTAPNSLSSAYVVKLKNTAPIDVFSVSNIGRIVSGYDQAALGSTWGHTLAAPSGYSNALSVGTAGLSQSLLVVNTNGSFKIGHLASAVSQLQGDGIDTFSFDGAVRQKLGINATPVSALEVYSLSGYNQFKLKQSYTPTGTADSNGTIGDTAWDTGYFYLKTNTGAWGRVAWDFSF